ncbi:hypothetical protein SDC9_21730 [bioreactor metagenome]|uniref:LysM domain-containing protein n=1 Tax=bioreactor metagenome TaxID=1076179 RepID=A0A644UAP6_9ZZZZ
MFMKKNKTIKKTFYPPFLLLAVFILVFGFIHKADASIFSGMLSLFTKEKNINNIESVDVTPFLLRPSLAKASSSLNEVPDTLDIEKDGALRVQSGSMRVSTEKEKVVDGTISVYEVKSGDTLDTIAKLFNVNKNTIIWANDLSGKTIKSGDTLLIFPMDGIQYTVKNSGTIEDIAKKYKVDAVEVAAYNGMTIDTKLGKGDTLFIPDAEAEIKVAAKPANKKNNTSKPVYKTNATNGYFMMPVVGCVRTQGLHGPYSTAVDYGCRIGTQTVAAAAGTVLRATAEGYNGGYGGVIIISHPNKTQTIYSHMDTVSVSVGQSVEQGQVIGTTGNTGRSTGPHLHFETRGTGNPF